MPEMVVNLLTAVHFLDCIPTCSCSGQAGDQLTGFWLYLDCSFVREQLGNLLTSPHGFLAHVAVSAGGHCVQAHLTAYIFSELVTLY